MFFFQSPSIFPLNHYNAPSCLKKRLSGKLQGGIKWQPWGSFHNCSTAAGYKENEQVKGFSCVMGATASRCACGLWGSEARGNWLR